MIDVYVAAVGLVVVAVLYLLAVAFRAARARDADTLQEVFRQRHRELAAEADVQGLDMDEKAALEEELALNHLDEAAAHRPSVETVARGRPPVVPLLAAVGLALVAAFLLYALWGEPNAALLNRAPEILRDADPGEMRRLEGALERRLTHNTDDIDTLFHVGYLRMQMANYGGAVAAFAALHAITGPNEQVDLAWIQASYLAHGRTLTDTTRSIIERVLSDHPDHPSVLEFLAMDAIHRGDYAASAGFLGRALQQAISAQRRALLRETLELVLARTSDSGASEVGASAPGEADPSSGVAVLLSLDEAFEVDATLPVFVIARDPGQPRPPVAVRRLTVGDLPAQIEITDADSMMPGRRLADFDVVQLLARVSLGGSPTAESGDLASATVTASPGARRVVLRIDRRVP